MKCKKCKKKFESEFILVIEEECVYCFHNTNEFYLNGILLTKQEAIEKNKMFEKLIKKQWRIK